VLLGAIFAQHAHAIGDPVKGADNWDYLCNHCHGKPQPNNSAAFKAYGTTANPLSLYASNPAAITRATNAGYIIPKGNTNDDYEPGSSTARPMGSFVGMGDKHMGVGDTPSQYAIDISAYLASYFDAPGAPTMGSVVAGNAQATVNFTAPKSDLAVASYTVTVNPGGLKATGAASPITVQGLSNGTTYSFTVTATSNAGTGKASLASNSVTPLAPTQGVVAVAKPAASAVPATPVASQPNLSRTVSANAAVATTVVPVNTESAVVSAAKPLTSTVPATSVAANQASVPKTAPAAATTAPAGVAARPSPSIISTAPAAANLPSSPKVVPTTAGAAAIATSANTVTTTIAAAKPSALVIPPAPVVVANSPAAPANSLPTSVPIPAPVIVAAKPGSAEARVFFTVPQDAITLISSYTVVAYSGGKPTGINATGAGSPLKITGLTNGTDYVFYVFANGKTGARVPSVASNVVTPLGIFGN